jgi:integrase
MFKKYENKSKQKIKIKEIDSFLINDFIDVIIDKMNYAPATARRHVTRLKFFLNRAENMDIKVNQNYKERVFVGNEEEDILAPYLNEEEIDRIFNLDLSSDDVLENIRDSFIISLWSGLRISDFNKNLNTENIDEDFINIKTTKTQAWVNIPLHSQVKQVLKKRFGYLPIRYSDKHFNDRIKTVCMLANIDEEIRGKKFDSDVKRKVIGTYKKYDLISSHTGRRSFATNLFGVVPNSVIMSVAGWSSEKVFLSYIKRTKKESALILKNVWDEKYK